MYTFSVHNGTCCVHTPTPAALLLLCRIHDREGTGFITQDEFGKLHEFLTNVQQSFEFFDQKRRNCLGFDEICKALDHAGETAGL